MEILAEVYSSLFADISKCVTCVTGAAFIRELANVVAVHICTVLTFIRALLFALHLMESVLNVRCQRTYTNSVPNHTHIQCLMRPSLVSYASLSVTN